MSNQKKTHDLIRQNEKIVKKSKKHEANLQKNSTLYFQIGLVVCLLAAFGLLEMKFETDNTSVDPPLDLGEPEYVDIPFVKEEKPVIEDVKLKKMIKKSTALEIIDDDIPENPIKKRTSEPTFDDTPPLHPDVLPDLPSVTDEADVPIHIVEIVPVYPGCEKSKDNKARKKCMSEKISKLIQRKFEGGDIADTYGLIGRQKIDVQFKINKAGHVTDIITRSPHPKLDEEAVRVINFIPQMTPGRQRDKNVGVIYNLPIIFQVQ
ncbi:energy transducer TonB [uncultured Algibacter sp.]|uniref:energy transducer TonB n=1 Tax=uncultured Algibacter sp. TaxID=298659 RepID=UPI0026125099|nr:energy transducer TonB [uncultured Algibacter sp.]